MATETESRECPFCKEDMKADAIKCKHCGSMVGGSTTSGSGCCEGCAEGTYAGRSQSSSTSPLSGFAPTALAARRGPDIRIPGPFGCEIVCVNFCFPSGCRYECWLDCHVPIWAD